MLAKIYSAAVYGVEAYEIEIEVNGAGGDPNIVIVGLPDAAVKESRDRVTTAIANSGYYWPRGRTTINLAPADIKKEGPSFDLPIALGMIAVTEELDSSPFENFSFVGELALDGSVQGELTDEAKIFERRTVEFFRHRDHSKSDWQVEAWSLLFDVCRGEIDRGATAWPIVPAVCDRGGDAVPAFFHCCIWQANNDNNRVATRAVHFDLHFVRVHAVNGRGINFCQHRSARV